MSGVRVATEPSGSQRIGVLLFCLCLGLLAACATRLPFERPLAASPAAWLVGEQPGAFLEQRVLWGGMVIENTPRERFTEIELLVFPLDAKQQPQAEQADEGRIILIVSGFADPAQFAPGRFITFPGRVSGARHGLLRNENHVWPMVDSTELYLWPRDFRQAGSRWSFGIGVRL